MASFSLLAGLRKTLASIMPTNHEELQTGQDVTINFFCAEVFFIMKTIENFLGLFIFVEITTNGSFW